MKLISRVKIAVNRLLAPANMRLDSLTAQRAEDARLQQLVARGHFERPVFPVLRQFEKCDPSRLLSEIGATEKSFASFVSGGDPTGFTLDNDYYTTPDAEVLFAVVQLYRPSRIVEVGSGNSTRLFRAALNAGGIPSKITSIDPSPRREIGEYSDEIIPHRVEDLPDAGVFTSLSAGDILFIDSSHEVKSGNDVVWLMLSVIPHLQQRVLIHVHDIFLPYEYPEEWVVTHRWGWNEQYLLQAFLTGNQDYQVLWAGHYLQKTMPEFAAHFPNWRGSTARSLWMRRQ